MASKFKNNLHSKCRRRRDSKRRAGVESVEIAVTMPLLVLATFATIQINHHWHMEKMLKVATYEAVKAGARKDGTSSDVNSVFQTHCKALGVRNATIIFNARRFDSDVPGTRLVARGRAPVGSNRLNLPFNLTMSTQLQSGYVVYRKEGL